MFFSQWSTDTKIPCTHLGSTLYPLLFVSSWWLDIYPENEKPELIMSDSRNIYVFPSEVKITIKLTTSV